MKIAFLINALPKVGPVIVLHNLIRNLDRNRHEVHVILLAKDDPAHTMAQSFSNMGAHIHALHCSKWKLELCTSSVVRRVQALLDNVIHPDIVHTHGYHPVLVASHLQGYPRIETLHNIAREDYILSKGWVIGKYMTARYYAALRRMDLCVAISEAVRNDYVAHGLYQDRINVVYNGIDTNVFCPPTAEEKLLLKEQLGFTRDATIFVVVGNLIKVKDPMTVVRAFRTSGLDLSKYALVFLGEGELRQLLEHEARGAKNIRFVGWRPNPEDWLKASDYSICASLSEGFGLNCVEALLCGLPVIMSDIPPFREFLRYNEDLQQLVFPPTDVVRLASSINRVTGLRIDPSALYRQYAAHFSAKVMSDNYLGLYEKLSPNSSD